MRLVFALGSRSIDAEDDGTRVTDGARVLDVAVERRVLAEPPVGSRACDAPRERNGLAQAVGRRPRISVVMAVGMGRSRRRVRRQRLGARRCRERSCARARRIRLPARRAATSQCAPSHDYPLERRSPPDDRIAKKATASSSSITHPTGPEGTWTRRRIASTALSARPSSSSSSSIPAHTTKSRPPDAAAAECGNRQARWAPQFAQI